MTSEEKLLRRKRMKSASNRARYLRKRDELLAKNKDYRDANLDRIKKRQREHRLENLEKRRAQCRKWHSDHRDDQELKSKRSERSSRHYQQNKSRIRKKHKEWLNRNPGYMSAVKHRRRLIENASNNLAAIKAWMKAVKSKSTAICYYCQTSTSTRDIHFDHIVSIANGGIHDVSNLCVSCASCNLRKQDKPVAAWVRIGQQVLSL